MTATPITENMLGTMAALTRNKIGTEAVEKRGAGGDIHGEAKQQEAEGDEDHPDQTEHDSHSALHPFQPSLGDQLPSHPGGQGEQGGGGADGEGDPCGEAATEQDTGDERDRLDYGHGQEEGAGQVGDRRLGNLGPKEDDKDDKPLEKMVQKKIWCIS